MSMKHVISILSFLLFLDGLFVAPPILRAQPYPAHPIQLVIPGAPGDAVDIAARSVADELGKILNIAIIPFNKPGAGAMVATDFVAKGKKDGYTLLYAMSSGLIYNPVMSPETVPYDSLRDVEPLGMHVTFPGVLSVQADSPWKNFNEVIEYSRKNPGKFRCGSLGIGAITHFQLEMIKSVTATDITYIPFKGASPAVTALLGGHIESSLLVVVLSQPHFNSGKLRGLLLDEKVAALPDIPTLRQLGYDMDLPIAWFGFFAPAGIPDEAKKVLVPAIEKAIKTPELAGKLQNLWYMTNYKSPAELKQILAENYEKIRTMAKKMGLTK
jgi:tripartite-type tricarboxylate transporter receptor subunit TctC